MSIISNIEIQPVFMEADGVIEHDNISIALRTEVPKNMREPDLSDPVHISLAAVTVGSIVAIGLVPAYLHSKHAKNRNNSDN